MGRRMKGYGINKKYLYLSIGIALFSLGLVLLTSFALAGCRNPLLDIIDSSGITIKIDGKAIQPGALYDLGRVKRGGTYSAIFTIQNSGNLNLRLTGDPLVRIIGDPTTVSMFGISTEPLGLINVNGSTNFTLAYSPIGEDVVREIQLLVKNNSRKEDFSFELTSFVDGTAPTVKEISGVPQTYPARNATGVSTNVTVSATFSEAMDPDTFTTTSFTLTRVVGAVPVNASVSYDSSTNTAFLDPIPTLEDSTEYEAKLSNTITDLAGNPMVLEYLWSFTTGIGIVDSEPPTITGTVPAQDATGVALSSVISATFDEPLDPSTTTTTNFIVAGATAVSGTVSYNDSTRTITFTPAAPGLESLTTYTARLTTGIRDLAQNALASPYEWSFTTEKGTDTTGPTVIGRNPAPDASNVATNTVITAEFNELLDPLTVNNTTFTLTQLTGSSPGAVSGVVSYNAYSKTAIFTPGSPLAATVQYRVTLTTGIKDIIGNRLASDIQWFFTTGAAPDGTAPTVLSTNPNNAAMGVLLYGNITATFSESMDPGTITGTTFLLFQDTVPIPGTVSYSEATKTATFDPTPLLDTTTVYTAKVIGGATGARDAAGNPLAADKVWDFTTEAGSTNPIVIEGTLCPPKNAEGVDVDTSIQVEFSKMMNSDTITIIASTFLVSENAGGTLVAAASITYNETIRIATFTPSSALKYSTVYKVECTAGMEDIGGNPLIGFFYLFTTMPDNIWDSMVWDVGKWAP